MRQLLLSIIFLLLLLLGAAVIPVSAAQTRLSGDVTLGMAAYRAEEAGVELEKITSLYQQYTLSVARRDTLGDSRLGTYSLLLGYEFNVIDAERIEQGERDAAIGKMDAGKIYYNANILLAPGGLPFRLNLFADDLTRSAPVGRTFSSLRLGSQANAGLSGHLVDAEIPVDLKNGTHRNFGGTLLVGIRNGSYLGQYRDVLSQLPRLLIDYRQEDAKDLHSHFSPTHYRYRDLAFVSLNKKDNWVHLRLREYTNFLDEEDNQLTKQVMIGTIDHALNRQWINLTNWIKISGELSYTEEEKSYWDDVRGTYNVNLFAVARNQGMNGSILSSFERENNGRLVKSSMELPISASIEQNRDTLIRTRFITEANQTASLAGVQYNPGEDWEGQQGEDKSFYLDVNADLRRTRQVVVKPRLEMELKYEREDDRGIAVRVGGELTSSPLARKGLSWSTGYFLTSMQTEMGAGRSNYMQNDLYGRIDKDINSALRIGGHGRVAIGTGDDDGMMGFRIPKMSSEVVRAGPQSADGSNTSNGNLTLFLDHQKRQLGNRLELAFDFTSGFGDTVKQSTLRHVLAYRQLAHTLDWESEIVVGDEIDAPQTVDLNYVQSEESLSTNLDSRSSWSSRSTYHYDPSRSTALRLIGAVSGAQTLTYSLSEELTYRLYTTNGMVRRIAEFSEMIRYEKASQSSGSRDSTLYSLFSASYLPTKYFLCKVSTEIVSYLGSGALQQTNSAEVVFGFEKLKFLASYSRGEKDRESDDLPQVMEERWDLKVKKIF
jgi:hypothetical protein